MAFFLSPYIEEGGFLSFSKPVDSPSERWTDGLSLGKTIHLMQFTGLKDKNGKEIWEGDVVRLNRAEHFASDKFTWTGDVQQERGGLWEMVGVFETDDEKSWKGSFSLYPYTDWMEVIGNIYENPELLQQ